MKEEKISPLTSWIFVGLQLIMAAAVLFGDTPWWGILVVPTIYAFMLLHPLMFPKERKKDI